MTTETDPRYPHLTESGKSELSVYLGWIQQANIPDSEASFVTYVLGRAGISDPRQLLKIWEYQMGSSADNALRRQIRRFFLNPSQSESFATPSYAGWFEFLESVYTVKDIVGFTPIIMPRYTKVGFSEKPGEGSAFGFV
jgi:hypothetical protein